MMVNVEKPFFEWIWEYFIDNAFVVVVVVVVVVVLLLLCFFG